MLDATSEATALDTVHGSSKEEYRRMKAWLESRIASSKTAPIAEIVTLTPCLAHLLLQRNPLNRKIAKANSLAIASDIASGRFSFNGQSIVVSDAGTLNDGQHRCDQVIKTGQSIRTVIVFGPDEATRFSVDSGKSKTSSDYLHMKGRKYPKVLSTVVGYHLQYRTAGFIAYGGGVQVPTKAQVVAAADELNGIDKSIEFTAPCMETVRSHNVLAFCHYVFKRKSSVEAADEFIRKLIDGDDLRKNDPVHYCRNRLLKMHRGDTANTRCELIFKCWNLWRAGGHIQSFRATGGRLPKLES